MDNPFIESDGTDHAYGKGPKYDKAFQKIQKAIVGLRSDSVFANVLSDYSDGADKIKRIVDLYWFEYINKHVLPVCEVIYDDLKKKKCTSPKKAFRFGSDDRLWIVNHKGLPEYKVFVQALQSANFIYFFTNNHDDYDHLHIRQFYNDYKIEDEYDERDEKDFKENIKKYGKKWALRQEYQMDEFANDVLKCPSPTRFSYKYFTAPKFKFRFEDSRDDGYVVSSRFAYMSGTMNSINNHTLLKCLFDSCLTQALTFLCGYKHHYQLSRYFDADGNFIPEPDDE